MTAPPGPLELHREVASVALATQNHYIIKRKFWSVFERVFRVFTHDGQLFMYIKHPILRLREEFVVFADEAQTRPVLKVKSKQVIAINFAFDITDAVTNQLLGTVQKRGWKSILRDKFILLDAAGNEIGYAEEQGASILRRFIPLLTSQHAIFAFDAPRPAGSPAEPVPLASQVAAIQQTFRFFTKEFRVDLRPSQLDQRFVLAVALLALIAESRREDGG